MDLDNQKLTDHEALILLTRDVQELKISQANFHQEMRESMKDLQNNYSARLDNHENRLVGLEATKNDFRQKLLDNQRYIKFLIWVGIVLVGLLIWHITGGTNGFHI